MGKTFNEEKERIKERVRCQHKFKNSGIPQTKENFEVWCKAWYAARVQDPEEEEEKQKLGDWDPEEIKTHLKDM